MTDFKNPESAEDRLRDIGMSLLARVRALDTAADRAARTTAKHLDRARTIAGLHWTERTTERGIEAIGLVTELLPLLEAVAALGVIGAQIKVERQAYPDAFGGQWENQPDASYFTVTAREEAWGVIVQHADSLASAPTGETPP